MSDTFRAIVVDRDEAKVQSVGLRMLDDSALMDGDVTVAVEATTLNYKDALAITGKGPIVRHWPLIPGIDFAGTVTASDNPDWKAGDAVILNGWGVGESHHGGHAERARVKGDWLIRRPEGMSATECMAVGTAGYTAMLAVMALEEHGVTPDKGPVIVTGAAGGVGTIAIALLAKAGFHVVASTGRPQEAGFLMELGAAELIDRASLSEPGRPLDKAVYAGGIDSVGSHTLANVLARTLHSGTVAACGLAQGSDLPATVMPFILRGVTLAGIDSVMAPRARREQAWARIVRDLDRDKLAALSKTITLDEMIGAAADLMAGTVRGRVVARVA